MSVFRISICAAIALCASVPALAQDAAPTAPAAPAPKPVKEKKICRSEAVMGSNLPSTTCHTKAEWVSIDNADRANARDMMSHQPPR